MDTTNQDEEIAIERAADRLAAETPPWAEALVAFLDDGIRVPFTRFRFGFDAIIGLIPAAGDTLTGMSSVAILALAVKQGVPTIVLLRMTGNIAVDVLVGAVPFVGDAFDLFFKSNRRNLDLLERFRDPEATPGAADYAIVGLGVVLAVLMVALPLLFVFWLGGSVLNCMTDR